MKQHTYRITVAPLADRDGRPVDAAPLVFVARNHDDLLEIVERIRSRPGFEGDDGAAFALGLKLFGETLLERRDEPMFTEIRAAFGEFMKKWKRDRPA